MNTKEIELRKEKITNRILINFGVAILAYLLLLLIYRNNINNTLVYTIAGIFFVSTAVFTVLTVIKGKQFKNYAIASGALTLGTLFLKLSVFTSAIIGTENFRNLVQNPFMSKLMNAQKDVIIIAILGAVYLVLMMVYNIVQIIRTK